MRSSIILTVPFAAMALGQVVRISSHHMDFPFIFLLSRVQKQRQKQKQNQKQNHVHLKLKRGKPNHL